MIWKTAAPACVRAKILSNRSVADQLFEMVLAPAQGLAPAQPGQFVHVSCNRGGWDPLLRRPLSVYWQDDDGRTGLLYRAGGRGTRLLAEAQPGSEVDLIGPLGRGFWLEEQTRSPALVGGGVGVPPLYFLARRMAAAGLRPRVDLGFASKSVAFGVERFRELGSAVTVTTVDGSLGLKGLVTAPVAVAAAAGTPIRSSPAARSRCSRRWRLWPPPTAFRRNWLLRSGWPAA